MALKKSELFRNGIYAAKMTARPRLEKLIRRLWPVRTGVRLLRIGGPHDGGYLIPDDLDGIRACFSPGVDVNASFEHDLKCIHGIGSHLADYSVEGPPMGFEPLSFTRKFLGAMDSQMFITLETWVREHDGGSGADDLLLQMDIEGGEFTTILAASEQLLQRFRIICIEIHDVEGWGQPNFFGIVEAFFEKLLRSFHVVHNHPNNCCGLVDLGGVIAPRVFELTLLRKDRASPIGCIRDFPHPLDAGNLPDRADLPLPDNWRPRVHPLAPDGLPRFGAIDDFLSEINGLIHVGANTGQERAVYDSHDLDVLWLEPLQEVYRKLQVNIRPYPKQQAMCCLVTDRDDVPTRFNIASNTGESSSILDMALHRDIWPTVGFVGARTLTSITLDSLLSRAAVSADAYQALVIDTQGAELLVLRGARNTLAAMRYVKLEAADFESYVGGATLEQLTRYLQAQGFREMLRHPFARHPSGGRYFDVLFGRPMLA